MIPHDLYIIEVLHGKTWMNFVSDEYGTLEDARQALADKQSHNHKPMRILHHIIVVVETVKPEEAGDE